MLDSWGFGATPRGWQEEQVKPEFSIPAPRQPPAPSHLGSAGPSPHPSSAFEPSRQSFHNPPASGFSRSPSAYDLSSAFERFQQSFPTRSASTGSPFTDRMLQSQSPLRTPPPVRTSPLIRQASQLGLGMGLGGAQPALRMPAYSPGGRQDSSSMDALPVPAAMWPATGFETL